MTTKLKQLTPEIKKQVIKSYAHDFLLSIIGFFLGGSLIIIAYSSGISLAEKIAFLLLAWITISLAILKWLEAEDHISPYK